MYTKSLNAALLTGLRHKVPCSQSRPQLTPASRLPGSCNLVSNRRPAAFKALLPCLHQQGRCGRAGACDWRDADPIACRLAAGRIHNMQTRAACTQPLVYRPAPGGNDAGALAGRRGHTNRAADWQGKPRASSSVCARSLGSQLYITAGHSVRSGAVL